jgi:formylglycine-generating enzyme
LESAAKKIGPDGRKIIKGGGWCNLEGAEGFRVVFFNMLIGQQTMTQVQKDAFGKFIDITVKNATQRFRWIAPGVFMMGSPENEPGRFDDEVQHEVTIKEGFWIADTPITQEFYEAVMGKNPSYFKGPKRPVETVSWYHCQEFSNKLTKLLSEAEGTKTFSASLPTEEQWEYACRAGTTTAYNWGDTIDPTKANYYYEGSPGETTDVKKYGPNQWGLYDMHGNVWEWCQNEYKPYK